MKLIQLKLAGFRGFNSERTIDFHQNLTLVYAPNSHGKTSISEALEFLINGETSKVSRADSKEEYRDSYRNRHFPGELPAYIEALVSSDNKDAHTLRIELMNDGTIQRFFDGSPVEAWPFAPELATAASPFVLQHALKDLLLVKPSDRFQGFARLLGLDNIDQLQQVIINLCTKPESSMPSRAREALTNLQALEARVAGLRSLENVAKEMKKGSRGLSQAYKLIESRADSLVNLSSSPEQRIGKLLKARTVAASKVFDGSIDVKPLTSLDETQVAGALAILQTVDGALIKRYGALATLGVAARLEKQLRFLEIGIELIVDDATTCPFCEQPLRPHHAEATKHRHAELGTKVAPVGTDDPRVVMAKELQHISQTLASHREKSLGRISRLLQAGIPDNTAKIEHLFGEDHRQHWRVVQQALVDLSDRAKDLTVANETADAAMKVCITSIRERSETLNQIETLALAVDEYLSAADKLNEDIQEHQLSLSTAARVLAQMVDDQAGTTELSLLIDLLENRRSVERQFRIRGVLESLKTLKKIVEQTVGEFMEDAIDADLTGDVMDWYGRIRTPGDPNVHFSGFAMERTKSGDFRSKRVQIKASSYGVELASAVSSLSESKLNALGLCVSIASTLRSPGPWKFLILDDPIQSWDAEHEIQFIDIMRSLAEVKGKQVIVLSHKDSWITQVCEQCRTVEGLRYEITGYTKDGPVVTPKDWATVKNRLTRIRAVLDNPSATDIELQQIEEEVRIAACQLAAEASMLAGHPILAHKLGGAEVKAALTRAGCDNSLVDRIGATFVTTDDAHHAPIRYEVHRKRIEQYLTTLHDLEKHINAMRAGRAG